MQVARFAFVQLGCDAGTRVARGRCSPSDPTRTLNACSWTARVGRGTDRESCLVDCALWLRDSKLRDGGEDHAFVEYLDLQCAWIDIASAGGGVIVAAVTFAGDDV